MKKFLRISIYVLVIVLPAVFMTWNIFSVETVDCEVCIKYRGKSQCRKATGQDKETCQRTATDNACAFLSSGMTDSISCSNTVPTKVEFF